GPLAGGLEYETVWINGGRGIHRTSPRRANWGESLASQTAADVQTNPVLSALQVVRSPVRRAGWPRLQARGVPAILRQSSSLYKMHNRPSQTPVDGRGDPDHPAVLRYPRLDSHGRTNAPCNFHAFLDRFYQLASDSIVAHDGMVDKVVGDEVIGLFFGGIIGPRHAAAAVAAAIDLSKRAAPATTTPAVALPG